jgi:hypothetical protein
MFISMSNNKCLDKDCIHLIEAGKKRSLMIMAVVPKPSDGSKMVEYYPTAEALLECGIHQVYEPPMGSKFDIVECAAMLKTIEAQQNLRFLGVVPCRESSVDFSDILGALLGLTVVNDLGLANARRDKGLMKVAVANAGLRVAKYARLTQRDGSDALKAIDELELSYPVVVKTPRGMSTMDVFICSSAEEAVDHTAEIVRSVGPDGRRTQYALLEEFIGGEEFAINLLASPTTPRGVQVTDIWLYHKINAEGVSRDSILLLSPEQFQLTTLRQLFLLLYFADHGEHLPRDGGSSRSCLLISGSVC